VVDETGKQPSRRSALSAGAAMVGWAAAGAFVSEASAADVVAAEIPANTPADQMVVTLLGTGSPDLVPDRFGTSTLIQAGGMNLLFDAGRGCALRLNQIPLSLSKVDAVFITHFHSDHLNGLPDLWMMSYLPIASGMRRQPLALYGPKGIARIATTMRDTFSDDVRIRMGESLVPASGTEIAAKEFDTDGVMFERNGVQITAFAVDHGPFGKPAYGYRINYAGKAVLISGDIRPVENLIAHAQNVTLLIHEVFVAPPPMLDLKHIQAIRALHTTPEEAGAIFARVKPKMAAFTHVVKLGNPDNPAPTDREIEQRTRQNWSGPLVVGTDLTQFLVRNDSVTVRHGNAMLKQAFA